jgi:hypothetical protein
MRGERREVKRQEWAAEREALDAEDRAMQAAFEVTRSIVRGLMEAAGFHLHARGLWRRRRKPMVKSSGMEDVNTGKEGDPPFTRDQVEKAVGDVKDGVKGSMARLREMIRIDPVRMLKVTGGDLVYLAQQLAIGGIAGDSKVWNASLEEKLRMIRAEMAGPNPSANRVAPGRSGSGRLAGGLLPGLAPGPGGERDIRQGRAPGEAPGPGSQTLLEFTQGAGDDPQVQRRGGPGEYRQTADQCRWRVSLAALIQVVTVRRPWARAIRRE